MLRAAFDAGVRAVHPAQCLPAVARAIAPPTGRTVVVGAGKAAATMAAAFRAHYPGTATGVVVSRRGQAPDGAHGIPGIAVLEAGHPVPDAASVAAAGRVLAELRRLRAGDRVVALLSGGGSALMASPAPGLTLADKQAVNRALLAAGASIAEINCVRRKLSAVKGGRLALAAAPAAVTVLAISDVPGDDVADIASGPFSPDVTTLADARAVLARPGVQPPAAVARLLADASRETPKPGERAFRNVETQLCARSADAVAAAAQVLARAGYAAALVDAAVDAPARELARAHADILRARVAAGTKLALVTGGETTVRVRNAAGRGGRNGEYLLALALELRGMAGVWALAADTDGIDGTGDNSGALLGPDSLARATALGLDATALLERNASYDFFAALGDLVVTGQTGTNANDLRLIVISPGARRVG